MLIGNKYTDNRMYRGIKYYDKHPLLSEDIHEYADLSYMKNAYIMNNLVGYGFLNTPKVSISTTGIRLSEPAVLMIDGDISLIHSDGDNLLSIDELSSKGYANGTLCIVGWYQHISNSSKIVRSYGGVRNNIIENTLDDNVIGITVSSRYQFRWDVAILDENENSPQSVSVTLNNRDESGNLTSGRYTLLPHSKLGATYIADAPSDMSYATSSIYITPLIQYVYDDTSNQIARATSTESIKIKTSLVQDISTYIIPEDIDISQNISIPLPWKLEESDLIQITYQGLSLCISEDYMVDYDTNSLVLLDFTVKQGERLCIHKTRLS